jgi:2-polyprenyl-3-methyl-5-hydroxy-6-metoxy-1,4-benzoquinol methylase
MAARPLAQRLLKPELMDQAKISSDEHAHALSGLGRLNAVSLIGGQLWQEIVALTGVQRGGRLRILDVACGGGDVALGLWKLATRRGVQLDVLGIDINPTACIHASRRCHRAGKAISFSCVDVIRDTLPSGFDVVLSSLFLHHLQWDQAINVLSKMGAAGTFLIVSDLRRSVVGYTVAHVACRVMTRSRIVHYDGPQSVANAFTLPEMRELCKTAGLSGVRVRHTWPWRLMLTRSAE